MRFLTAISALIMAAAGTFCFLFYINGYAGVAFVLGVALLLYGLCHVICYAIGFRQSLLPETLLVEGFFSMAFGFLVFADLVSAASINIYFGAWFIVTGLCRFSQALNVSKINPRNWFAVLPLGIINTLIGFVMLAPSLLESVNGLDILWLIAVACILQAMSVAVYTLYMVKKQPSQKAQEAKERAEAKKIAAEARRKERDRVRQLSEAEREAELEKARLAKVKEAEEKAAARAAKRQERRPATERTMEFTAEETAEINALAEDKEFDSIPPFDPDGTDEPIKAGDIWESPAEEDLVTRPVFNKPVNIPIIEKKAVESSRIDDLDIEAKRAIVNLEEFESKIPEIELPKIELPEVELKAAGGEAFKRQAFLLELEDTKPKTEDPEDLASFTPLTLEELFSDERFNIKPLSDKNANDTDLKLTQTFTFDWLDTKKQ